MLLENLLDLGRLDPDAAKLHLTIHATQYAVPHRPVAEHDRQSDIYGQGARRVGPSGSAAPTAPDPPGTHGPGLRLPASVRRDPGTASNASSST